jgi:hypothetical protein
VRIELTGDQALVLHDFLARFSEGPSEKYVEDRAEQLVLGKIQGLLESTLAEISMDDYEELVEAARDRVRGPEE